MIETRRVEYLGLVPPNLLATSTNAQLLMSDNCVLVVKDYSVAQPMCRLAIVEIEELLSEVFGCRLKIVPEQDLPTVSHLRNE